MSFSSATRSNPTPRQRIRGSGLAAAMAFGLLVAGCSESSQEPADPTGGPGEVQSGTAPMPTNVPPGFLECGSPLDDADGYQLIDADLTQSTWELPENWLRTYAYHEENPVEKVELIWTAEPIRDTVPLNVINVVIYSGLDWEEFRDDCGRIPVSAIGDQLEKYNAQIGARVTKEAEFIEFAGVPAITQDVALTEYAYTGVWLFSRTHLLHTYCQWTTNETQVREGCEKLFESFTIPVNENEE